MAIPVITGSAVQGALNQLSAVTLPGEVTINNTGGYPLVIKSIYANAIECYVFGEEGFKAPYINLWRSKGTEESKLPPDLNGYEFDVLAGFMGGGWDGEKWVQTAGMVIRPGEDWQVGKTGTYIVFYGVRNGNDGSISRNEILQLGGPDSIDQTAQNNNGPTENIISQRPIAWYGNRANYPMLKPIASGGGGVPPKVAIRSSDDSMDGDFTCGAASFSRAFATMTKPRSYTVATLPSASANAGWEAEVTDSSVATFRSTVAGGGSQRVDVKSNGTNWLVN